MYHFTRSIRITSFIILSLSFIIFGIGNQVDALSTRQNISKQWEYTIYLTHPTTKVVSIAKKWIEKNRIKILNFCKSLWEVEKISTIQCVWNSATIFTKKNTQPKKIVPKTSSKNTTQVPSETKSFDGYLDGRIVVSMQDTTQDKALETCGNMKSANPKSEIMCRWGDTTLGNDTAQVVSIMASIELIKSNIYTTTNIYLAKNKEQEVGRFSLKSNSGTVGAMLDSITITQNGSARFQNYENMNTSARLVDVDSGKDIPATVSITDKSISFTGMTDTLTGNTTKTYKILLGANVFKNTTDTSTIWLIIDSQDIKIIKKNTTTRIPIQWWILSLQSYIIGTVPPTVNISSVNENIFHIQIKNPDPNYPISISNLRISTELILPGNKTYIARACIRDTGIARVCDNASSFPLPGSDVLFSLEGSSVNTTIDPNNTSLDYDFYMYSDNIFPDGWQIKISLNTITYMVDGKSYTQSYGGIPESKSQFIK